MKKYSLKKFSKTLSRYAVDKNGNIYNVYRNRKRVNSLDSKGYVRMTFVHDDGVKKNYYVHRVVASVFHKKIKNKTQVNHINGVRNDNRVENLEWCNQSENIRHSVAIGTKKPRRNEESNFWKLSNQDVIKIRSLWNNTDLSQPEIASRFDCTQSMVSRIVNNKTRILNENNYKLIPQRKRLEKSKASGTERKD